MKSCEYYRLEKLVHVHPIFGSSFKSIHHCNKGLYVNEHGQRERQTCCIYFKDFLKCPIKDL